MPAKQTLPGRKRTRDTEDDHTTRNLPLGRISCPQPKKRALQAPPKLGQAFLTFSNRPLHVACDKCGMQYTKLSSEDGNLHAQYCKSRAGPTLWPFPHPESETRLPSCTLKKRNSNSTLQGYIINIRYCEAEKRMQAKLQEIAARIDEALNASPVSDEDIQASTFYLFIRTSRDIKTNKKPEVVGCAITRPISKAYRAVCTDSGQRSSDSSVNGEMLRFGEDESAIFCYPRAVPALVGVDRIWTTDSCRGYGVATTILDDLAARAIYGTPITKLKRRDIIAFSQPSRAGARLFTHWTETCAFLVFTES